MAGVENLLEATKRKWAAKEEYTGKQYTAKCGTIITVVHYEVASRVTVSDPLGNTRIVNAQWLTKIADTNWYPKWPFVDIFVGKEFRLRNGITVTVVEAVEGSKRFNVVDSVGNIKSATRTQLRQGNVGWGEFGVKCYQKGCEPLPVGTLFRLSCGVEVSVTHFESTSKVTVEDEFGNSRVCLLSSLRSGKAMWKFGPKELPYYVYFVRHNNEIVYIGKGKDDRYNHPNSGKSSNYELNRLHFAGEFFLVTLFRTKMSEDEALAEELRQIEIHKPRYNKIGYRSAPKKQHTVPKLESELSFTKSLTASNDSAIVTTSTTQTQSRPTNSGEIASPTNLKESYHATNKVHRLSRSPTYGKRANSHLAPNFVSPCTRGRRGAEWNSESTALQIASKQNLTVYLKTY